MAGDRVLEELAAERAIGQVMLRYARAVDALDFDLLRSCFHPDAILEYGENFSGSVDEAIEWLSGQLPKLRGTMHAFGPPLIELDLEAGTAECDSYALNTTRYPATAEAALLQSFGGTRYLDRFELRGDAWKLAYRRNLRVWSHTAAEVDEPPVP